MTEQFDLQINRRGTNCLKYDFAKERGIPEDALPMWVADMDFRTAPGILKALHQSVDHGIFGYTDTKDDYFNVLNTWFSSYHNWNIQKDWLVKCPGVVYAINLAVKAYTKEQDAIMIQTPVYYPFSQVVTLNNRQLIENSLVYENGSYHIDFQDMEEKMIAHKVKLLIFCSPHNPVGRVWTRAELEQLSSLCIKHSVLIVSDEIHSDFTYPGHPHTVLASLNKETSAITITCTAPSKTFNLAGLQVSNIFIENESLRAQFKKAYDLSGYCELNQLGLVACKAAYETGREWLDDLLLYLQGNLDYIRGYLAQNLPNVKLIEPEGTYLIWLDFSAYGLTQAQLDAKIRNEAKLWLDKGTMFGSVGTGFERINIACPRATVIKAMEQLKTAF